MAKRKKKYYVVWEGRKRGIYETWSECEKQVKGFPGAKFKSYPSIKEAKEAFHQDNSTKVKEAGNSDYIADSISVDAGTHGNPGPVEYRGVCTKTGEVIFASPVIQKGTNNMGEFLAIVDALKLLQKEGKMKPIYSDSATAMKWVKDKKVKSTLKRDEETEEIWSLVEEAEQWLKENDISIPILKWDTRNWGEVKADYGRK